MIFHTEQSHRWPWYISFPTEYGTLYSKAELQELHNVCRQYEIPLFVDGARLGYGLMSRSCDLTLAELVSLCDVFYIGGTKVGALLGAAVVFPRGNAPAHFMTIIKQHGALLAKGRVPGIQFETLFTDDLYFKIGKHAIDMAEELKALFHRKGYSFYLESPTNQQFLILENVKLEKLQNHVAFSFRKKYDDDHSVIRFATSWATQSEYIRALESALSKKMVLILITDKNLRSSSVRHRHNGAARFAQSAKHVSYNHRRSFGAIKSFSSFLTVIGIKSILYIGM